MFVPTNLPNFCSLPSLTFELLATKNAQKRTDRPTLVTLYRRRRRFAATANYDNGEYLLHSMNTPVQCDKLKAENRESVSKGNREREKGNERVKLGGFLKERKNSVGVNRERERER